jgi:Rha family phage regulatory protein
MSQLVQLQEKHALTTSQLVAKEFGVKHQEVMRRIDSLFDDYPDLREVSNLPKITPTPTGEIVQIVDAEYRGTPFKAAIMNKEFFTLLAMRFDTVKARELQRRFIHAFFEMEKRLAQFENNRTDRTWIASRDSGKIGRKDETDVIKEFVTYATEQGSKSAQFYYKHITMATYRALELLVQRQPKLRDTLNCYELAELLLAERLVTIKLKEYMERGRHYKDIYESVTADLMAYAGTLRFPSTQVLLNGS